MKFFKKLGLVVFSTIVLIISILLLLVAFNAMEPTIFGVLISKTLLTQKGTYILIGVCIVLIILAIYCLFFGEDDSTNKGKNSGIELENSDGRLLITKGTIEGLVAGVIANFPSIQSYDTDVIIDKENNVSIDLEIVVEEGTTIKDVSAKLQNDIKSIIKKSTDLEIDKVNIVVEKVQKEEVSEDSKDDDDD